MPEESPDLTRVLVETAKEKPADVAEQLMPVVYEKLHALAEKYLEVYQDTRTAA